jgi:CDP-diacylglycerol--serine O-phosphatidyltransferase
MKKHIPNLITLVNLFCGCLAIVFMLRGQYYEMFWLIIVAEIADLMDGLVARILRVQSDIGKDLDSLADMVTFGVVPGMAMYVMLLDAGVVEWLAFSGFIVTLASCMRLAKFNSAPPSDNFTGMPTPAITGFILGLLLAAHFQTFGWDEYILTPVFLFVVIILVSYLMLSTIPMFGLKFKKKGWKGNELSIIFLITGFILMAVFKWASFPIGVVLYVLLSLIFVKKEVSE